MNTPAVMGGIIFLGMIISLIVGYSIPTIICRKIERDVSDDTSNEVKTDVGIDNIFSNYQVKKNNQSPSKTMMIDLFELGLGNEANDGNRYVQLHGTLSNDDDQLLVLLAGSSGYIYAGYLLNVYDEDTDDEDLVIYYDPTNDKTVSINRKTIRQKAFPYIIQYIEYLL